MSSSRKKYLLFFLLVLGSATVIFFRIKNDSPVVSTAPTMVETPAPTFTPARIPEIIPIEDGPLKKSIIAAGDYLVRQQLSNGELSYQINILTGILHLISV
jgi:hypothetical protein